MGPQRFRRLLLGLGPLAAILIATWFYLTGGRIVTETDASVGVRTVLLADQVAGAVVAKPVSEGQLVESGTELLELEPAPYRIALATAKAQHWAALDHARAARLVYEAKGDLRKQTEASLALARETFDRVSALEKSGTAPPAQLDSARRDLRVAEEAMAGAVDDEKAALAQIGGSSDTPTEQMPSVRQAQLAIENAERNLALTRFAAPFRGIVTGADSVQLGSLISIGQSALALAVHGRRPRGRSRSIELGAHRLHRCGGDGDSRDRFGSSGAWDGAGCSSARCSGSLAHRCFAGSRTRWGRWWLTAVRRAYSAHRDATLAYASLAERLSPFSIGLAYSRNALALATARGAAEADLLLQAQAQAIAFANVFWLMAVVTLCVIPLVWLLRPVVNGAPHVVID